MPAGSLTLDAAGQVLEVSAPAARLLGVSPAQAIGVPLRTLLADHALELAPADLAAGRVLLIAPDPAEARQAARALDQQVEQLLATLQDPAQRAAAERIQGAAARLLRALSGEPPPSAPPTLNAKVIDDLFRLMHDALPELLAQFLEDTPEALAALRQAAACADTDALRWRAHRLKGGAGMLGAQALASLCRQLEAAACEPHEALALVDELEREFERVRLAIEPRLPASD